MKPMPKFPFIGYHGIRRFKQGRYYIRQSVEYRDGCLTILAGAMRKFDVGVSSYSFMSTHYHVAAHDLDFTIEVSRVGAFFQFLSSTLSKWLNHMRDTTGHIACPDMPFKPIGILDVESELRTDLYVELNPVTAGVVEHPRELNGLTSFREMLLEPLVIRRPEGWFDPKKWPEESQIQLSVPPRARAAGYSRKTWYLKTVALQETLRARIVAERKAAGKRTRSLEWARRQTPETTGESIVDHRRVPFTGQNKLLLAKMYEQLRTFWRLYRLAVERLKGGMTGVRFPAGTQRMALCYGFSTSADWIDSG